jgi:hypothetical protein
MILLMQKLRASQQILPSMASSGTILKVLKKGRSSPMKNTMML